MANIKSAKKRVLIAEKNRVRNVAFKTSIKTAIKKVLELASGKDKDFYEGKIAASRYFIHNFLPLIAATRAIVEREDGEIMKVSEAAF